MIKKIQQFLKKLLKTTEAKGSLDEQLNYIPINNRYSFNDSSYKIEKSIHTIFSSKEDSYGKVLVELVILVFEKMGYKAKNNDGLKDNKKDIIVYKPGESKPFLAIQCKSYSPQNNSKKIDNNTVLSFIGATPEFENGRIFITSSYFNSRVIREYSNQVILIDRKGLLDLLIKYFPKETLNVFNSFSLHELEYTCSKCNIGKLHRVYYKNNNVFHCTNCQATYKKQKDRLFFTKYDK
ncbi:restriction endonuclease [Streptococcus minor]|uniref:Restriction endonuclease n=1 Tax=Streptococcus minor TaxID=229549 RepID=A0A3P1VB88_9STRE|nr:restriction endonuclease [Streptococcus minor]RRD31484.1 restriction endonuclease [Streptococcus minor]